MNRSKSKVNLNQLLQDLPESTQQALSGGGSSGQKDVVFVIIGSAGPYG